MPCLDLGMMPWDPLMNCTVYPTISEFGPVGGVDVRAISENPKLVDVFDDTLI
jgi:hypothetical protein